VTAVSRRTRSGALAVSLVAAAGLLAACDKPVPEVTVLSGATTTRIPPARYCFDAAGQHCRTSDAAGTVRAQSNGTLLVDVPRTVADTHWLVTAYRRGASGKPTPLDGYGSPTVLSGRHSIRLPVPYGEGTYYISVVQLSGPKQVGQWTATVEVLS
jgi:hypothetical protein